MNCPNCDCYTPDGSLVCVHCGAQLPAVNVTSAKEMKRSPASGYQGRRAGGKSGGKGLLIIGVLILVAAGLFFMFKGGPSHAYVTEYPDGPVDLSSRIESGRINIVDLYSEFCPPCRAIAPYLEKLAKARPDIHVIRIDINRKGHRGIDWGSPIVRQFNLKSIPHFILVNGDGRVLEEGKPAYAKVVKMIKSTLTQ